VRETTAKIVEATLSASAPFLWQWGAGRRYEAGETGDNAMRKIAIVGGGSIGIATGVKPAKEQLRSHGGQHSHSGADFQRAGDVEPVHVS